MLQGGRVQINRIRMRETQDIGIRISNLEICREGMIISQGEMKKRE
jgi:hypothetical protein